jgi:predicted ATPase
MITKLILENFKSWQQANLSLGRISVLFGTNSSGKSSLLQSLLLLKQTVENFDRSRALHFGEPQKDFVQLGNFEEMVYGHKKANTIAIGLDWRPKNKIEIGPGISTEWLSYEGAFQLTDEQVVLSTLSYGAEQIQFALKRGAQGKYSAFAGEGMEGTKYSFEPPESCYGLPHQSSRHFHHFFPLEFSHQFESLMSRIRYLGPLRQEASRVYSWSGSKPNSVGLKGEYAVQAMLSALKEKKISRGRRGQGAVIKLHEEATKWMQKLGVADKLQLVPLDDGERFFEVKLQVKGGQYSASLVDVGVGVSQVLPVIVQLYFTPPGSILLFEQPEIHLHPSVQASLADLFIDAAEVMGHQLIIESHSEHFLVRMQRRIAEAETQLAHKEFIKLYVCGIADGRSKAKELELDEYGRIREWPQDFFGDTLEDREAIMRAMIARKKREKRS